MPNYFVSLITIVSLIFSSFNLFAQNPTGYIATWKNDAKGAYTIIHDDYGDSGVDGIWQYADTIAFNRGIKFTIGAIASSCESDRNIKGYIDPYEYAKEVMIAKHGHEIMSHSHSHACAVGNAGWSPCEMTVGWGEDTTSWAFSRELESAHNSIFNGTGINAKYYIFPYDRFSDWANVKLKDLGYLGSRTGWNSARVGDPAYHRNGYNNSDEADFFPDDEGFFRTSVEVFDDNDASLNTNGQLAVLNNEVDSAIANNMWANRELHQVSNWGGGWGSCRLNAYRSHLDYVKTKMDAGELFVGTISEILTYQMQKLKFSPNFNYDVSSNKFIVSWNSINPQYSVDMNDYLGDLYYKSPITLVVDLDTTGSWMVAQNSVQITDYKQVGQLMYINVYPHLGEVEIYDNNSDINLAPYVVKIIKEKSTLKMDYDPFHINLKDVFDDETPDEDLVFSVLGNEGATVTFSGGWAKFSSVSSWVGTDTMTLIAEDPEGLKGSIEFILTVTDFFGGHTPFLGSAIPIPGRIEVEDYDEGGEGVSFHDVASGSSPDAADNPYRPHSEPDVQESASGDFYMSYILGSEWLEYTVDVTKGGWYNVAFGTAMQPNQWTSSPGELSVYIDNQQWIPKTTMAYTSDPELFTNVNATGIIYLTEGLHIMKIQFEYGGFNLDYVDVLESPVSSNEFLNSMNYSVFPNPANDYIEIKGDFNNANIYNQTGSLVISSSNKRIDISTLSEGVYYVKFDNHPHYTKLIKSK